MSTGNAQFRLPHSFIAWLLVLWVMLLAAGIPQSCASDDDADAVEVTVETSSGETLNGWIYSLNGSLMIKDKLGPVRQLEREAIVRLLRVGATVETAQPKALALLVNGDVLTGRPIRVGDELLSLAWSGPGAETTVNVPLEFVRAIVFDQPAGQVQRQQLQRQWGLTRSGSDRLLLKSGSAIDGELSDIDGAHIVLKTGLGPVSTPREDVVGLTLNADLATPMPVTGQGSILLCEDGSRVTLHEVAINTAGTISGLAAFGPQISLPLNQTNQVQFFSERVQPLTEREPVAFEFTPFLSGEQRLVMNRNVCGGPFNLRGHRFATGLGVHSRSEVTYDLGDDGWKSFTTTVGVDEMATGQGEVVFRVILDGEEVYDSGEVSGRTKPIAVGPIDLSGARRITLCVDFGRAGDIGDIANWCNPLLLR